MQYVKKAIPVRAIQWNGPQDNDKVLPAKITGGGHNSVIHTLEGVLHITPGSWVVGPGHKGEYWAVDEEVFTQTYQKFVPAGYNTEVAANALTLAISGYVVDHLKTKMEDRDYDKVSSLIRKFLEEFVTKSN